MLIGAVCAGTLVACGGQTDTAAKRLDIAKVFTLKSEFGPDYQVNTDGPSAIDPKLLGSPTPSGMTYDPADCHKSTLPPGLTGKQATISGVGQGNIFTVVAVESPGPVPYDATDAEKCRHVTYSGTDSGTDISGTTDIVDAPKIDGAQTVGAHQTATIAGMPRPTESYLYVAYLGNYVVAVNASAASALLPNQPVAPVDSGRAQKLLTDAVAAMRS